MWAVQRIVGVSVLLLVIIVIGWGMHSSSASSEENKRLLCLDMIDKNGNLPGNGSAADCP